MHKKTALEFYRKKQSLLSLGKEKPRSLDALRETLKRECMHIQSDLELIKISFYGGGKSCEDFINQYGRHLSHIIKKLGVSKIFCQDQIEDIMYDFIRAGHSEHAQSVNIAPDSLNALQECYYKIKGAMSSAFTRIMQSIRDVHKYLDVYCLSFASPDQKQYMEAATYYARLRNELSEAIKTNVDDIHRMMDRFKDVGLDINMFGMQVNEIARKCNCENVPFLFMFPQSCVNISNACRALEQWLQADELYTIEITTSMQEISTKVDKATSSVRELQHVCIAARHRIKILQKTIREAEIEVETIKPREETLKREHTFIEREYSKVEYELHIAENEPPAMDFSDAPSETRHLKSIRKKFKSIKHSYDKSHGKVTWIDRKHQSLDQNHTVLKEMKDRLKKDRAQYLNKLYELERLQNAIDHHKEILKFRTSSDTLQKIFYKIPFEAKHRIEGQKIQKDPLQIAIIVVSSRISKDWMKLYRNLAFFPKRGHADIEKDLNDIRNTSPRLTSKEEARHSLNKWRRENSRANLEDLKMALRRLGKQDLVKGIEDIVKNIEKQAIMNMPTRKKAAHADGVHKTDTWNTVGKFRPHRILLPDIARPQLMANHAQMFN